MYISIGNDEYIDAERILMILEYEQARALSPELKCFFDEQSADHAAQGLIRSVIITDGGEYNSENVWLSTVSVRTLTARVQERVL